MRIERAHFTLKLLENPRSQAVAAMHGAGGTNHLLGVCTTASDTLELLESQSQPVLVMISEVLDDSSGLEPSIQQLAEHKPSAQS